MNIAQGWEGGKNQEMHGFLTVVTRDVAFHLRLKFQSVLVYNQLCYCLNVKRFNGQEVRWSVNDHSKLSCALGQNPPPLLSMISMLFLNTIELRTIMTHTNVNFWKYTATLICHRTVFFYTTLLTLNKPSEGSNPFFTTSSRNSLNTPSWSIPASERPYL